MSFPFNIYFANLQDVIVGCINNFIALPEKLVDTKIEYHGQLYEYIIDAENDVDSSDNDDDWETILVNSPSIFPSFLYHRKQCSS